MLNAVIVEDEKKSRETLAELLKFYCQGVKLLGVADGVSTAKTLIKRVKPDIIFLDIQMPGGDGFTLLDELDSIDFDVIFTTAYDQYAIKAIKYSALDYLLKPIDPEELQNAIRLAQNSQRDRNKKLNIEALLDNLHREETDLPKIVLSTSGEKHLIRLSDIIRCQSDDYYTQFHLSEGKTIIVSKTLKEFEEMLAEFNFIRPHKSHLVNFSHISNFINKAQGYLLMSNGDEVPVSRRKKEMVFELLKKA